MAQLRAEALGHRMQRGLFVARGKSLRLNAGVLFTDIKTAYCSVLADEAIERVLTSEARSRILTIFGVDEAATNNSRCASIPTTRCADEA